MRTINIIFQTGFLSYMPKKVAKQEYNLL